MDAETQPAVIVSNEGGASPFVLVCDHASNRIPERYGDMGLTPDELESHIAWDPGALDLSRALRDQLDAVLVEATTSRLVIDANRELDAPDLIWTLSEATRIASNENLSADERQYRIDNFHRPYHEAIETVLSARKAEARESILVCVHSFTPVYLGKARPWPIGLIHGKDQRFTRAFYVALRENHPELNIGWNEPYAALNGVTLTLERHGDGRGLPATMIELRNNEIATPETVAAWSDRISTALTQARLALLNG